MNRRILIAILKSNIILFCCMLLSISTRAEIRCNPLLGDHMVLQRGIPQKIAGWTSINTNIEVWFKKKKYLTTSNNDGQWEVNLPASKAGGPYTIQINSVEDTVYITDILIGDVWVCSGQSNMLMTVADSKNADKEILSSDNDKIRFFNVPHGISSKTEYVLDSGQWKVACPNTIGNSSAVGYFFARELYQRINIPIGIVNSAWNGSTIEHWMIQESNTIKNQNRTPKDIKDKKNLLRYYDLVEKIKLRFPDITNEERGVQDCEPKWAMPDWSTDDWLEIPVPMAWENSIGQFNGKAWYRKTIELSKNEANQPIELNLGTIDESDITWINGKEVGRITNDIFKDRIYTVPASYLKAGKNIISIQVTDTDGNGGLRGMRNQFFVKTIDKDISLVGKWKFMPDSYQEPGFLIAPYKINGGLYNKMIHPLTDFPIKGVIWYQGEGNTLTDESSFNYRNQLRKLIDGWRSKWKIGDFPFLYVQLPNFSKSYNFPTESQWAILRASQTDVLKHKNTGQAVTIDLGDAKSVHPKNKQDIGLRLALTACGMVYDKKEDFLSPIYKQHQIKKDTIIISFDNIGKGLMVRDKYGYVNGFSIAGKNQKYLWAEAMLSDNQVRVWNEKITNPISVRYAWANNPDDVNLYTIDGLPVTPFQIIPKKKIKSPTYKSHSIEGNSVRIRFNNLEKGLKIKNRYGYIKGFSIAGADEKFHWAKAKLSQNSIVVSSSKVKSPVFIRYEIADDNLFSSAGLNIQPFEIDLSY